MTEIEKVRWHNIPWKESVKLLYTNVKKGLPQEEIETKQLKFGKNILPTEKSLSKITMLLEQFKSPMIYILVFAGIITLALQDIADTIVIFGAVFLNISVSFFQENKASQTLKKLKKIVTYEAEVLRDGHLKVVESSELVPGDIVIINPGDKVPADGRVIESHNLKVNEMALTGEWIAAKKHSDIMPKETPMADRDNMVYMGTVVSEGRGTAVITETGIQAEIGKVAQMIKEVKEVKTPYQKKLAQFSKIVGLIVGLISIAIFIEGILTGGNPTEMFVTAIAVAVASIPEGLPVAMTVILAIGMQRILKEKGLVRKLTSAETLGSTSVIATDKTGTLTEGKMKVADILAPNKEIPLKIAAVCVESFVENEDAPQKEWILRGRPTEKALLRAALEKGVSRSKTDKEEKRVGEILFSPINKYSATLYQISERKYALYVLGAPEKILSFSKIRKKEKEKLEENLEKLAKKGLRVLGTAHKIISSSSLTNKESITAEEIDTLIKDMDFEGFITLRDPVRKEAKKTMRLCRQAGMRVIMITGDHRLTAKSVAEELGIKTNKENILTGQELDELSEEEFKEELEKIKIYARVEPKHKVRIVNAWQDRGDIVAMTGDGINDAPALKKADVGVALGSGTDVAKDTSDLILLNDNFSIIVSAIEEGRAIIDNIRKVITYLLSGSFTEVILISVSLIFGLPLPVIAVQILWINLIEDGLPGTALAFELKEENIMQRKPQRHNAPLLTKEMKVLIFAISFITDLLLLGLFFWLIKYTNYEIAHIRSIIFIGLAIGSLFYIFSCKSLRRNIWRINLLSNKFLIFSWTLGIAMLFGAIYLSPLQTLLQTVPLNFFDWQLILGFGLINIVLVEATKWYFIARHQTGE